MKNIFKYTEKIFWFDSQGENIFSFQVFDDGSVEFYDFADERIPAEINNKYLLPSKYLREINILISKLYESWDFGAEDIIRDEILDDSSVRANIVEQSFLIYDAGDNIETKFIFKQGYMSSHFFCRKAPFSLITNKILDLIKRSLPYFQLQVE